MFELMKSFLVFVFVIEVRNFIVVICWFLRFDYCVSDVSNVF